MKKTNLLIFIFLLFSSILQGQTRWEIQNDGGILWDIKEKDSHYDHIEMSGKQISVVYRYGVNTDGSFYLDRSLVWPQLRTIPNNTHGSLIKRFGIDFLPSIMVNDLSLTNEKVKSIRLDGTLTVVSQYSAGHFDEKTIRENKLTPVVEVTKVYFPSTTLPMVCETYSLKNITNRPLQVVVPEERSAYKTDENKGVDGVYTLIAKNGNAGSYTLQPNESIAFTASIQGYKNGQQEINPNIEEEQTNRKDLINELWSKLVFNSPDPIINRAFAFAKIRGSESIYETKNGLMHGPGGERYYAAIWANDQAEYINPFFPFQGYEVGNESVINSFRHFARFMNDGYKPIPSSIIAEGISIWNGAGDRGDGAMIAYGAARYALARADKKEAEELWPLIEWTLEFCRRKINDQGVVASDSDELENRFPSGDANLVTSSLYYDALISASYLAKELKKPSSVSTSYLKQAKELREAMAKYFEAEVEGFDTYRYYDGNDILRSWICMPLTVGIFDKKEGTIAALLSPRLFTENGLLTQAGTKTFWDRSTLYALRGIYAAGERKEATKFLNYYSSQRLLGEHVPYPIEAWPEGNQRHLSAESGLYCRIITEGLFGIRPTGFSSFELTPQLPDEWNFMELNDIYAFSGDPFSIKVNRADKNKIKIEIIRGNKTIKSVTKKIGETFKVTL